jgi:hypothetical protein
MSIENTLSMHKKIVLAEEKDLGKIISDAFLFFKQQFWNYMNCLFITTAPFFIIYLMSHYNQNLQTEVSDNFAKYLTVGGISGMIGLLSVLNMSNIYMIAYSQGNMKIKASDLTKIISENIKGFLKFNFTFILFISIIIFIFSLLYQSIISNGSYSVFLSALIVLISSIGLVLFFQINASNIIALRENKGLIKSFLLVFMYSKKNFVLIWVVTLIAMIASFVLKYSVTLPLKIISIIGSASGTYQLEALLNQFPTLNIVLQVVLSTFGFFLMSYILIVHQILLFSLEEKYRGAILINQIKDIGDA